MSPVRVLLAPFDPKSAGRRLMRLSLLTLVSKMFFLHTHPLPYLPTLLQFPVLRRRGEPESWQSCKSKKSSKKSQLKVRSMSLRRSRICCQGFSLRGALPVTSGNVMWPGNIGLR